MTEEQRDRLFKAWADSMSRTTPELNPDVRRRVLVAHARAGRPSPFAAPYQWALGGFALAALMTAAVLLVLRAPSAPSFQVAGHAGRVGEWLTAEPARPLTLRFSEGTQLSLGQHSRGRVTQVARGG